MSELGQKLIGIVRRKAAERPNSIYRPPLGEYTECVYVWAGQPSCIIGHALFEAGLIDGDLPENINSEPAPELFHYLGVDLSPAEEEWLRLVQREQDEPRILAEAVIYADERVHAPA